MIFRDRDDWDDQSEIQIFEKYEFEPAFDKEMKVFWKNEAMTFATGTALLDFAFDKFVSILGAER
jgi:hypothetical protein